MDAKRRLSDLRGALLEAGALDRPPPGAARAFLKDLTRTIREIEVRCCDLWACCRAVVLGQQPACSEEGAGGARPKC